MFTFNKCIPQHFQPSRLSLLVLSLAALFTLNPGGSLFGQVLNLEDALGTALNNNEKIQQYNEKVIQKEYENKEAWGNFLPSVKLTASYTHLNDPMQIDLSPIRDAMLQLQTANQTEFANVYQLLQTGTPLSDAQKAGLNISNYQALDAAIPAFVETIKDQNYLTATLTGVQPLFMGGKLIAAKKYAAAEAEAARAEFEKTVNEIRKEVIQNYLSVALQQQVVSTRQSVLAGMQQHRLEARKLFDEGLIARYHLLRAEVAVSEAERNLFDDRNKLQLAGIALNHSLGLDSDAAITNVQPLVYHAISDSISVFLNSARRNQPILKMIAGKQQSAAQNYVAQRADLMPQLAAFGKYELYPEYLSSLEPRWVVGLQLNFELFSGFKRYNRLQSARHLKKETDFIDQYSRRQINLWVNKSFREMRNYEERYHKLHADIRLAKENVRLNDKRFHSGLGTSLEVIDARLMLQSSEVERLSSLFFYYNALNDLCVASGQPDTFLTIWNN